MARSAARSLDPPFHVKRASLPTAHLLPTLVPPPTDGVIALRPWTMADLSAITTGCRDPDTQHFSRVPANYTPDDARTFVMAAGQRLRDHDAAELAVTDAADLDLVLGAVGITGIDWVSGTAEIGYWVMPAHRRRGVATRAVRLATDWALTSPGLTRLVLIPSAGNAPSAAVAHRAGYTPIPVESRPRPVFERQAPPTSRPTEKTTGSHAGAVCARPGLEKSAPSGRFLAIPARRGNRSGVSATFRATTNRRSRAPANG